MQQFLTHRKAKLKSLHEVVVRNRLEQLRRRQRDEALSAQEELLAGVAHSASKGAIENLPDAFRMGVSGEDSEESIPYDRSMSPAPIDIKNLRHNDQQLQWVNEEEDLQSIVRPLICRPKSKLSIRLKLHMRRNVANSRFVAKREQTVSESQNESEEKAAEMDAEALYRAEAEKELDEEEELFNLEETIQNPTTYNWEDKYRPRKPRYFNRVHTGYEWNKYNQTHYEYVHIRVYDKITVLSLSSTDNPPPKVVQGYKVGLLSDTSVCLLELISRSSISFIRI